MPKYSDPERRHYWIDAVEHLKQDVNGIYQRIKRENVGIDEKDRKKK